MTFSYSALMRHGRLIPLVVASALVAFSWPLWRNQPVVPLVHSLAPFCCGSDGWIEPYMRSAALGVVSAIVLVPLAFVIAVWLRWHGGNDPRPLLVLLILPLTGSMGSAFAFKLLAQVSPVSGLLADRNPWTTWPYLILADAWQSVPLFVFFFWLQAGSVRPEVSAMAKNTGMTLGEQIRDVLWPHCRDLGALMVLFAMTNPLHHAAAPEIVIRASSGTNTEVIGTWLHRNYMMLLPIVPDHAVRQTLLVARDLVLINIIVTAGVTLVAMRWFTFLADGAAALMTRPLPARARGHVPSWALAAAAVAPLALIVWHLNEPPDVPALRVALAVSYASLVAATTLSLALLVTTVLRLVFPRQLQSLSARSLPIFVGLLSLRFVPSFAIVLCGFSWLATLPPTGVLGLWLAWAVAQTMVALPLVLVFAQSAQFAVPTAEIEFGRVANASLREIARDSFIGRNVVLYGLVLAFAFSLVLSEDAVNNVMAFAIPSVPHELFLRLSGRGGSYASAAWLLTVLLAPVLVTLGGCWMLLAAADNASRQSRS